MSNEKEAWWNEYRKRRIRFRRQINIGMAVRQILRNCFKEYVNNCSIAGVKQMNDREVGCGQRFVWIIFFCVMVATSFYFFWYVWFGSLSKPLIVNMESSTYPITEIDFPAIAICNVNRISRKAMYEHELQITKQNISENQKNMYTWQLGRLLDFTYDYSVMKNKPWEIEKHEQHRPENIVQLMKKLSPSCDEMLIKCTWAGETVDCKSIFQVRRTARGHCCAFNYVLDYDSAGAPRKKIANIKRQMEPGIINGLNLVIDPMLDDYAYTTRIVHGLEVLIFDPTHFADPVSGRVSQRIAEPNEETYLELRSVKQIATREVRKYALKTRKCLFHDEMKNKFKNMYSYSACLVNCRIKTIQALCKCTPYFLPDSSNIPVCTLEELACLNKYKEKFLHYFPTDTENVNELEIELQDSLKCPDCFPDCEFTTHLTKPNTIPFSSTNWESEVKVVRKIFTNDINMTNKCFLSIYQSSFDGTLGRLDVVYYWFEYVSNVGGVGGVLVGLSVISAIELVYFFVIRFFIKLFELTCT